MEKNIFSRKKEALWLIEHIHIFHAYLWRGTFVLTGRRRSRVREQDFSKTTSFINIFVARVFTHSIFQLLFDFIYRLFIYLFVSTCGRETETTAAVGGRPGRQPREKRVEISFHNGNVLFFPPSAIFYARPRSPSVLGVRWYLYWVYLSVDDALASSLRSSAAMPLFSNNTFPDDAW